MSKKKEIPEDFINEFTVNSNKYLQEHYQISHKTLHRWAVLLGLKKDKEYLSKLHSDINKGKRAPSGPDHYRWKGGKSWKRFADPDYIYWRKSVLSRDSFICQHCFEDYSSRKKGLHAHHIQSYKDFPELRFDVKNGLTLCKYCHMKVHGKNIIREKILCGCGCGIEIDKYDVYKRERRFLNHHGKRGYKKCQSDSVNLRVE